MDSCEEYEYLSMHSISSCKQWLPVYLRFGWLQRQLFGLSREVQYNDRWMGIHNLNELEEIHAWSCLPNDSLRDLLIITNEYYNSSSFTPYHLIIYTH